MFLYFISLTEHDFLFFFFQTDEERDMKRTKPEQDLHDCTCIYA